MSAKLQDSYEFEGDYNSEMYVEAYDDHLYVRIDTDGMFIRGEELGRLIDTLVDYREGLDNG